MFLCLLVVSKRLFPIEVLGLLPQKVPVKTFSFTLPEMHNWRIVTQEELDEFLPPKASERLIHERLKLLVNEQELDRQTIEDIIRVLREKGYNYTKNG